MEESRGVETIGWLAGRLAAWRPGWLAGLLASVADQAWLACLSGLADRPAAPSPPKTKKTKKTKKNKKTKVSNFRRERLPPPSSWNLKLWFFCFFVFFVFFGFGDGRPSSRPVYVCISSICVLYTIYSIYIYIYVCIYINTHTMHTI